MVFYINIRWISTTNNKVAQRQIENLRKKLLFDCIIIIIIMTTTSLFFVIGSGSMLPAVPRTKLTINQPVCHFHSHSAYSFHLRMYWNPISTALFNNGLSKLLVPSVAKEFKNCSTKQMSLCNTLHRNLSIIIVLYFHISTVFVMGKFLVTAYWLLHLRSTLYTYQGGVSCCH